MESIWGFFSWLPFSTHETWGFVDLSKDSPWLMNDQWWSYCWWTKSCTTKDDYSPIIYRVLACFSHPRWCRILSINRRMYLGWSILTWRWAHEASEDIFALEFWKGYPPVNWHGRLKITHFLEKGDTSSFMVGIFHCHVRFCYGYESDSPAMSHWSSISLRVSFLSLKKKLQATTGSLKSVVEYGDSEGCLFWPGLAFATLAKGKSTMNDSRCFFFLLNMWGIFQLDLHGRFFGKKSAFFFPQKFFKKPPPKNTVVSAFFLLLGPEISRRGPSYEIRWRNPRRLQEQVTMELKAKARDMASTNGEAKVPRGKLAVRFRELYTQQRSPKDSCRYSILFEGTGPTGPQKGCFRWCFSLHRPYPYSWNIGFRIPPFLETWKSTSAAWPCQFPWVGLGFLMPVIVVPNEDLYIGFLDPHTKQVKILVVTIAGKGEQPNLYSWVASECSFRTMLGSGENCHLHFGEPTPLGRFSSSILLSIH